MREEAPQMEKTIYEDDKQVSQEELDCCYSSITL